MPSEPTYLHFLRVLLAHADDISIHLHGDGFGEGHCFAAPVVVLHGDIEGDERGVG